MIYRDVDPSSIALPDFIFVYGTLKKGYGLHDAIKHLELVDNDFTMSGYAMYDLGAFPAITLEENSKVHGELYRLPLGEERAPMIAKLNFIEGYPTLYQIHLKDAEVDGVFRINSCMLYAMDSCKYSEKIPSGRWEKK